MTTEKKSIHELVREFNDAIRRFVDGGCDNDIDLNVAAALLPDCIGSARVQIAKLIALGTVGASSARQSRQCKRRRSAGGRNPLSGRESYVVQTC